MRKIAYPTLLFRNLLDYGITWITWITRLYLDTFHVEGSTRNNTDSSNESMFKVVKKVARCTVPTVNPHTGIKDTKFKLLNLLKKLRAQRYPHIPKESPYYSPEAMFGVNINLTDSGEAKIGSRYFPADLSEMPEKMEKWKESFPDGLLQQVMKSDSYSTYVCSNTKVSDFIASSIEKRIQELIKLKYNIHRIDRLVISDADGPISKKLFSLARYSTFPPTLDEKLYKWELIDASPDDDDTQCDLYCIPKNFGSSDLTRKPPFIPLRAYFNEYIKYLLHEVQAEP